MCAKRQKNTVLLVSFHVFIKMSVSPWLSHIHHVYKFLYYSLQQFFVIHPLVVFVHLIVEDLCHGPLIEMPLSIDLY